MADCEKLKAATTTNEQVQGLANAAHRVEVLMDTLALSGIGEWLYPQHRKDWAIFHVELQEALEPFLRESDDG